jgi:hypothetical protein
MVSSLSIVCLVRYVCSVLHSILSITLTEVEEQQLRKGAHEVITRIKIYLTQWDCCTTYYFGAAVPDRMGAFTNPGVGSSYSCLSSGNRVSIPVIPI